MSGRFTGKSACDDTDSEDPENHGHPYEICREQETRKTGNIMRIRWNLNMKCLLCEKSWSENTDWE